MSDLSESCLNRKFKKYVKRQDLTGLHKTDILTNTHFTFLAKRCNKTRCATNDFGTVSDMNELEMQ